MYSQRIEPQDMSNGIGRNEWQANRFDSEFRMERISPSFLLDVEGGKDRERRKRDIRLPPPIKKKSCSTVTMEGGNKRATDSERENDFPPA